MIKEAFIDGKIAALDLFKIAGLPSALKNPEFAQSIMSRMNGVNMETNARNIYMQSRLRKALLGHVAGAGISALRNGTGELTNNALTLASSPGVKLITPSRGIDQGIGNKFTANNFLEKIPSRGSLGRVL